MAFGTTVTRKGYVRVTSGPFRHEYYHRLLVKFLLWGYPHVVWGRDLPANIHVHHVDHDKRHNSIGNFLLLDEAIHNAISRESTIQDPYTGQFLSRAAYERRYKI
jgi:hypothetical protein